MSEDAHQSYSPLDTFDATVWAAEFIKLIKSKDIEIDADLMISWFANALMKGFDEHSSRITPTIGRIRRDAAGLATHIRKHINRHNKMPMPVIDMTEGERSLFRILAADRGLLVFLENYLKSGMHVGENEDGLPPAPPDFYETLYLKDRVARAEVAIEEGAPLEKIKAILGGYDD